MRIEDEEQRVTPLGLLHSAIAYANSATALSNIDLDDVKADDPIRFLYTHAIELYLKAYLRLNRITVHELRSKDLGHKISKLADKAQEFGLEISSIQRPQLDILDQAMLDRYPVIGVRTIILDEALLEICKSLHEAIALPIYKSKGITRRPASLD